MPWVVNWTIKERSAGIAHPTFTQTAGLGATGVWGGMSLGHHWDLI